jgi:hypothetical protein
MRTLSVWRHALLALSFVTISSTAIEAAATEHAAPAGPGAASKHASNRAERKRDESSKPAAKPHSGPRAKTANKPSHASGGRRHQAAPPSGARPAHASPAPKGKTAAAPERAGAHPRTAKRAAPSKRAPAPPLRPCLHEPVTVVRGADNHSESFALTRCDGRPAADALDRLSTLSRTHGAPAAPATDSHAHGVHTGAKMPHKHAANAPIMHRGLLSRLQAIASHFPGGAIRIASGYRPTAARSFHQSGRALDIVIPGVSNDDLVAFCRTLPDTGCGYYPNSTFVHIDVRNAGTGHVYWIDASKPGEPPRYVTSWPEKDDAPALPASPPPEADSIADENATAESRAEPAANGSNAAPARPAQPRTDLAPKDVERDSEAERAKGR